MVLPIYGQTFIYNIPARYYSNGQGEYPLELQVAEDVPYVVVMRDATGMGSGGSTLLQTTQPRRNTARALSFLAVQPNALPTFQSLSLARESPISI
jgi:hypothetical protein